MNLGVLEGLLFVVGEDGITIEEIIKLLDISKEDALNLIEKYKIYLGNKYKLSTKEEHKKYYELLIDESISSSLTQTALEVLAIIAYNEPITVGNIDEIRGVSSRDMVRKLLYKGLIDIAGKSDLPGKPMLYRTTNKFLDYFNLSSITELPELNFEVEQEEDEKDLFNSKYKEEKNY